MRWMRAALVGLLAVVCLGAAGRAVAGEYHVYSCRTPGGGVAPADGWVSSQSGGSVVTEDQCAKGGALVAGLREGVSHPVGLDVATWALTIREPLQSKATTLWRAGDSAGGAAANATYEFWFAGPIEAETFSGCVYVSGCMTTVGESGSPLSPSNLLSVPVGNAGERLYMSASCGGLLTYKCPSGKGDANGYAAVVYLYAADLVLEQTTQPAIGSVNGELATAASIAGAADLSFEASDTGSGVYQAVFTVDGVEVGRTLIDENGGHCRDVGGAIDGLPAFLYLRPCAASVRADLAFDTTALSDGTHHLVVEVTDAAGNSTVALDRKIDIANHPALSPAGTSIGGGGTGPVAAAANGTPASAAASLAARWGSTAHSSLIARFGAAQTVTGRLTAPDGQPIADAVVQARFMAAALGARAQQLASVRTGADGRFGLRLPRSLPSGRLTLSYSSHAGQAAPDVTAALTLSVPASLRLNVTPRASYAGGTIRFAGTLRGVSLPRGGKQVVLEAREAGSRPAGAWRQFRVLDTGAHGSFRASYRFRLPGPVTYQFRAFSPHEADFPYGAGGSNMVSVHVR